MTKQQFEKEKKFILQIHNGNQHKVARTKWLDYKRILDKINKKLHPAHINNLEPIKFDDNEFTSGELQQRRFVFEDLLKIKIASATIVHAEKEMISAISFLDEFRKGHKIIIRKRRKFEEYLFKVQNLCNFIEEDGKKRFPKLYGGEKTASMKNMVNFNDNKAQLMIDDLIIQLPPYKNEHYLCRVMYTHTTNEPVDWSEVYEQMTGYYEAYYGKLPVTRASWRIVYDTMVALNNRIKEVANTDNVLFTWQEKTIQRKY